MLIFLDEIELPTDLHWQDKFSFSPVSQNIDIAVDGSQIIESALQMGGRPITLLGGDDFGWIDAAVVTALQQKQWHPGLVMTLTLDNDTYQVLFEQPNGLVANPLFDHAEHEAQTLYIVTLKFITLL